MAFSFFSLLLCLFAITHAQALTSLKLGKSLSVEKQSEDFLISPNSTFSCGFYKVGTNAYCFAIWFTNSANKTVVWMANRDTPVNGKRSKLSLLRTGKLVLTDWDGSIVWSTNTRSESHLDARLLETGNLVLMTQEDNVIIWESFRFPTDTLLPDQPIIKNTTLVSMRSRDTYLSGYYNFKFDDNNVLHLIYNGPFTSSIYWPNTIDETVFEFGRTPYNSSRSGFLSNKGGFRASDNLKFNSSNYGIGPKRRLTLDYDGVLRVYSLDESTGLWEVNWLPDGVDACKVHGLCGPFGVCSYNPFPTCSCPYGFYRNDPSDWFKGCSPLFNLTCNQTDDDVGFITLPKTDYSGYDLNTSSTGLSFEACKNACLTDCKCQGFAYSQEGNGQCFPKWTLLDGFKMPDCTRVAHIKVPKWVAASQSEQKEERSNDLNCSAAKVVLANKAVGGRGDAGSSGYLRYLIAFVGSFAIIELVCIGLGWWFVFRRHVREELANMGYAVLALGFKRFSFAELKRATQNFKEEIGKGGFGTVYRGVLDNQRAVAVKRLDGVLHGESEFWAEVSIIGKLNHRNLVKMWGFCAEGKHKLLVYDYMENGSLDKILFSESKSNNSFNIHVNDDIGTNKSSQSCKNLGWEARYNIALGTAKGLAYIHEECLEWMIHCDVKPQNILLDEHLEPMVTDFGMSKLFKDNLDGGFSRVRGTRGYLAPEWVMNRDINAKVDVYSYGIVLLELLTGKRASEFQIQVGFEREYNHLVQWVRENIKQRRLTEVIDHRLSSEFEDEKVQTLMRIALLCVVEDRDSRPAMSEVVELLVASEKTDKICPEN